MNIKSVFLKVNLKRHCSLPSNWTYVMKINNGELLVQLVGASASSLSRVDCDKVEPPTALYVLSVLFTLNYTSVPSHSIHYFSAQV